MVPSKPLLNLNEILISSWLAFLDGDMASLSSEAMKLYSLELLVTPYTCQLAVNVSWLTFLLSEVDVDVSEDDDVLWSALWDTSISAMLYIDASQGRNNDT